MLRRHIILSACMLLLSSFTSQVYALVADVDQELEQQLDRYVELTQVNRNAGVELIQKLAEASSNSPALQSRARLLGYLTTNAYYEQQHELAENLLQRLLHITEQTDNANTLSEIYATELELLLFKQKISDAIIKSDRAQSSLEHVTNARIKYYSHNVLGRLYQADGQYSESLQHFIQALDALSDIDSPTTLRRQAFLNYNIATVHAELKNWSQARLIAEQLLADSIKYQHNNFLPQLYLLLGYIANAEKNFHEALGHYEKGLAVADQTGWEGIALTFENNIGSAYIELQQYSAAKKVLLNALQRAKKLADDDVQNVIKFNLAYILVMEGEHVAGIAQLKAQMDYLKESMPKAQYESYYEWLAKAYAAAGQYKQQAEILLIQMRLREEIRSADRDERLSELHNRFDNKAQAQKIIILEQENSLKAQLLKNKHLQQKLTFLFVLLMLMAAIALFYLYRKVRNSNRQLYETNQLLAIQSKRDPLTGLYNRRALLDHMEGRSKRRRENDTPANLTGILMLDIDFFKRINDNYGHSAGDAVLIELSKRLQRSCREQDLVVRWGGEEILLLLDNVSLQQVSGFIKRILNVITELPIEYEKHSINVTASGGFIHLPFADISEQQLDWEKVMQIVDMALYLSKANGRNQVCMINDLKVSFEQAEALLYTDLAGAIREDMVGITTITGPGGSVS